MKAVSDKEIATEIECFSKGQMVSVELGFKGKFSGTAAIVFKTRSASKFVDILTGTEASGPDLDSIKIGALSEVSNIVINSIMGSISSILGEHIEYSLPFVRKDAIAGLMSPLIADPDGVMLLAQTRFLAKEFALEGDFILIFSKDSLEALLNIIDGVRAGV